MNAGAPANRWSRRAQLLALFAFALLLRWHYVATAEPVVADPDAIPIDELKAEEAITIRMPEEPVVAKPAAANGDAAPAEDKARWLKIRVRDTATGKNKVSITLPLGVVRLALALGSRFSDDMAGMDTDALMAFFKAGQRGVLVEAEDEEDNEHVQIYLD